MREIFQKFFNKYLIAAQNKWSGSEPFVQYINTDSPSQISQTDLIDTKAYLIEESARTQRGRGHIVYLFKRQ